MFSSPHILHGCFSLSLVSGRLRPRIFRRSHPVTMALTGMEFRNLLLHDLDGVGVLKSARQLGRLVSRRA